MSGPQGSNLSRLSLGAAAVVACLAAGSLPLLAQGIPAKTDAAPPGRNIRVPFDHGDPRGGSADLHVDFGAPFDAAKPTVLVIADGQQFYVRPGAMADLQRTMFGSAFNVAGIVTRGSTPAFLRAAARPDGSTDWQRAWRLFNASQWVEDIEDVRRALVGDRSVMFFGRSGGSYLVQQYLAKHGSGARRAFIQSAVNPSLNRELGIPLDTYWDDLHDQDPSLQPMLSAALTKYPGERIGILLALQRQHFYVPPESLASETATFIRALARGDTQPYAQARKRYEVDDVLAMSRTPDIVPQDVRVVELVQPSGAFDLVGSGGIFPLAESQAFFTKPLLDLLKSGEIAVSAPDGAEGHRLTTEVFVLAGRNDEAVDYRTSIALAASYARHQLFIANDNHVFARMNAAGQVSRLVQAFFSAGVGSTALRAALDSADAYRWHGR